ncbi:tRNA(Thr) (cytosine(32)-N(3))-methyltransferase [Colletotrichum spaethianum]|uniref:tRNA(Ile)-lysidine synthetase n=1 Tax=Colletotrichum spaethianum TaxID=700344 RepID=A0AA37PGE8_9PEZI|nr:tRNA(Thr) (cytosine(32)-N(3))-methyltransferase [Colletotrichum spaethianum]GKT51580.1 tRNA(Thr) (cytosine(32)-N(3))-methyltransferase [Colletotrichum spaethianum]
MGLTNPPLATATAAAAAAAARTAAATTHQFLHPVPKPIGFLEFFDAVRAATPPRFPHARMLQPRRIGLAISGGVDSMALAFLFNQLRETNPLMRIVDNPLTKISAVVIDHGLREGSGEEALAVVKELKNLRHVKPQMDRVNWKAEGIEGDPAAMPNVESIARRARYRRLGLLCHRMHIESLFLAHHQDDQYETVLMRLLAGHGSRGLRGISKAANIPECYDMHGVYESGHVDDQLMRMPHISFRLPRRAWKSMRREMWSELDLDLYGAELRAGLQVGWHESPYVGDDEGSDALFYAASSASAKTRAAAAAAAARNMPQIRVEDAGIMIYRPLLEFSKDRLVATCEANNIRWFEDATNKDRTLTMRNAVRHMVREHALPEALRKENILRLAARCDARVKGQEWEAERWIRRGVRAKFEPNVGTLVVRLPEMGVPGQTRRKRRSAYDDARRELRLVHRRLIAALIVRKLVSFVSPDRNPPQLSSLQPVVGRLFPALAEPSDNSNTSNSPKAFNQASVLFLPIGPNKWYLVHEPYPSLHPLPEFTFTTTTNLTQRRYPTFPPTKWQSVNKNDDSGTGERVVVGKERLVQLHRQPLPLPVSQSRRWYSWRQFQLWDGRFWVRVRGRVKAVFRVAPFAPVHGKAFREALGGGEAPAAPPATPTPPEESGNSGSVRIGVTGGASSAKTTAADDGRARLEGILKRFAPGKVRYTLPALYAVNRDEETGEEVLRMLALPTLGICLPGLERWVQYEFRYRKVDMDLLDSTVGSDVAARGKDERAPRAADGGAAVQRNKVLQEGIAEQRVRRRISGIRRERIRGGRRGGRGKRVVV